MNYVALLVFLFAAILGVNGQSVGLVGRVYDANGALIVGSTITAVDANRRVFRTTTDSNGEYRLSLPFNKYELTSKDFDAAKFRILSFQITAEASYFEKSVVSNFKFVPADGDMRLDFALDVRGADPCHDPTACMVTMPIEGGNNAQVSNAIVGRSIKAVESRRVVIRGKVSDLLGMHLQKFGSVRATGERGDIYLARTNNEGVYFLELPAGNYKFEAVSDGFCAVVIKEYKTAGSDTRDVFLDFALPGRTRNAPCQR